MFESYKMGMIFQLVFFLALSTMPAHTQGLCDLKTFRVDRIKGKVVSEGPKGNEPIQNAKVELWRIGGLGYEDVLSGSALTNMDGLFEIIGARDGRYRLEVSKPNSGFVRN